MILGGHNSICNIRHLVACICRLLGTSRNWRTRSGITEDEDPREEVIIHLPIPRGWQYKRNLQARQKLGSGNESKILSKVNGAGVCAVFCAGGCGLVGLIFRHRMVDSSRLFVIQCQSLRNETTGKCRGETNLFQSSVYRLVQPGTWTYTVCNGVEGKIRSAETYLLQYSSGKSHGQKRLVG